MEKTFKELVAGMEPLAQEEEGKIKGGYLQLESTEISLEAKNNSGCIVHGSACDKDTNGSKCEHWPVAE